MARRFVPASCAVVILLASLTGHAALVTATSGGPEPDAAVRVSKAVRADGFGECVNPAFQLVPVQTLREELVRWRASVPVPASAGVYSPPGFVDGMTAAVYPRALKHSETEGAVLVLVKIAADGSVAEVKSVCATDKGFIAASEKAVAGNRYSAATFDGRPIPGLMFVPIAFVLID